MLFFVIMFVASIISMTKAPYMEKDYQDELGIHNKIARKTWRKKK
jgi:hypothetical protein